MASSGPTFEDELEALGFQRHGTSRRGGRMWALAFNRHLTFTVHDHYGQDGAVGDGAVLLTWSFALGEYLLERGLQLGAGDTSYQELYPQRDVRVPADIDSVGGEITRVLTSLRLDLGDPSL